MSFIKIKCESKQPESWAYYIGSQSSTLAPCLVIYIGFWQSKDITQLGLYIDSWQSTEYCPKPMFRPSVVKGLGWRLGFNLTPQTWSVQLTFRLRLDGPRILICVLAKNWFNLLDLYSLCCSLNIAYKWWKKNWKAGESYSRFLTHLLINQCIQTIWFNDFIITCLTLKVWKETN